MSMSEFINVMSLIIGVIGMCMGFDSYVNSKKNDR